MSDCNDCGGKGVVLVRIPEGPLGGLGVVEVQRCEKCSTYANNRAAAVRLSYLAGIRLIDGPEITIPESDWSEADEDSPGVLRGPTLWINGTPLHLEAHEVEWTGERAEWQVGKGDSQFSALNEAHEVGHPQVETEIKGSKYVLFAYAHGRC